MARARSGSRPGHSRAPDRRSGRDAATHDSDSESPQATVDGAESRDPSTSAVRLRSLIRGVNRLLNKVRRSRVANAKCRAVTIGLPSF